MPYKDPEKAKQNKREYYIKNKERIDQKRREYREANKERIAQQKKEYHKRNKEVIAQKKKEYHKRNKEKVNKSSRICAWKANGFNHTEEEIEEIHERYMNTTHCDCCNIELTIGKGKTGKCMDHCHKTNKFRNILCTECNFLRYQIDERYVHLMKLMSM